MSQEYQELVELPEIPNNFSIRLILDLQDLVELSVLEIHRISGYPTFIGYPTFGI